MTNFSSSRQTAGFRTLTCLRSLPDQRTLRLLMSHCGLQISLQAAATVLCLTVTCWQALFADEAVPAQKIPPLGRFGPPQILNEHVVRVRDVESLARTVRLRDDGTFSEDALSSLERFFAYPTDLFRLDQETSQSRSLRAEVVQLLQQSSPAAQRQWSQAVSTIATSQLKEAIAVGNRAGLLQVARRFPLTEPGIRAALLVMSLDFLKGRDPQVSDGLHQLQKDTQGTIHESFFLTASQALRNRVKNSTDEVTDKATVRLERASLQSTQLSVSPVEPAGTISPPWPRPSWNWTESIWTFPGVRQPQAGTALEAFLPTNDVHLHDFTNWRPVFWDDIVVHRSPFRIIAFNRKTGTEEWSLVTDTFVPEKDVSDDHADHKNAPLNSDLPEIVDDTAAVSGFSAYGLLSFDQEFLYFIDGFEFFKDPMDLSPEGRSRRFFFPGRPNREEASSRSQIATRLVAVRKSAEGDVPVIAWSAGEPHSFGYEFQKPQPATAHASTTKNSALANKSGPDVASPNPSGRLSRERTNAEETGGADADEQKAGFSLAGHRFLSPPVGRGQQLFVLTRGDGMLWLNCLARGTGEIEWQQPLAFSDNWATRFQEISNPASTCSVCLISNENVICSLSSGLVMAVRAADGQLQWAAAVRDVELQQEQRGFRLPLDEPQQSFGDSPGILIPFANEDIVVCSDSQSMNVAGIDARTGEILWQSPRRAFGTGDVGNSHDFYIAGLSGQQVIMIGERHCRSLDLKTGVQNWVVPVMRSTGRAECRGDRCLIPQSDGRTLLVNLQDGTTVRQRLSFLPEDAQLQYGAITSDDDIVCFSTPVSLNVFPRVDALMQPPASPTKDATAGNTTPGNTTPGSATLGNAAATLDAVRQNVQAHLLDGNEAAAVEILKTAISPQSGDSDQQTSTQLQRYLGELILQDWGTQWTDKDAQALGQAAPTTPIGEYAKLLPELDLTSEQQLRAAVLSVLSRPDPKLDAEEREQLTVFKDWKQPIVMTADWKVRSDLLLNDAGKSLSRDSQEIEKLSLVKLARLAEDVALFPELTTDLELKETLVARLLALGNYAGAEAVAIQWQQAAEQGTPDSAATATLAKLRHSNIAAISEATTGAAQAEAAAIEKDSDAKTATDKATGLNSQTPGPFAFESKLYLGNPDWDLQRVEKGLAINSLPDWVRLRYYLVDGQSGLPELVSVDMSDGSVRDRLSLPFPAHRNIVSFRGLANEQATPGLLPLMGADQMSMVSCTVEDKASILWTRRFRKVDSPDTPIEPGPLGPDFFVWHYGDELHCSHPLSGRDLWVRQLRLSASNIPFAGVRKIFGDRRVISVMGADMASVERFSTRDGRRLKSTRLAISRVNDAVTVGGCLLYPDTNSLLHCYSSAPGEDLLAGQPPIRLNGLNADNSFQVLPEGRVITVSSDLEIVLIDTHSGKTIFRTPARAQIATGAIFGITAFERGGKLFVGIEEQRDIRLRSVERSVRPQEPRLQSGPLICMDAVTGAIEWSLPLESAGIPLVYGDPTDLMLIWTNPGTEDDTYVPGHKINLRLINTQTGAVVATEDSISASRPLRCTHVAEKQSIEIMTRDTLITVQPAAIAGEDPRE